MQKFDCTNPSVNSFVSPVPLDCTSANHCRINDGLNLDLRGNDVSAEELWEQLEGDTVPGSLGIDCSLFTTSSSHSPRLFLGNQPILTSDQCLQLHPHQYHNLHHNIQAITIIRSLETGKGSLQKICFFTLGMNWIGVVSLVFCSRQRLCDTEA